MANFRNDANYQSMKFTTRRAKAALIIIALVTVITSCSSPEVYIVNAKPYLKMIEASPERVTIAPEDVEAIGGSKFAPTFRGSVQTKYGTAGIDEGKLFADVVIDSDK